MAISELQFPAGVQALSQASAKQQAQDLAVAVAAALSTALRERDFASLVVSGGRSPVAFLEALSSQKLDWARVVVSLADERWVPTEHNDSNEALVKKHLLRGEAARANFIGLYRSPASLEASVAGANLAVSELPQPLDVLVLGMGDDGHTASLFPNSPQLAQALSADCPQRCLPMLAPTVPHQRITLTLPVLASARSIFLAVQGPAKLATLRSALAGDDALAMPIRAFLRSPLTIYWCP
ncbi:MAG: 6-phosphogluconolactonase [Pseudomonas sp.]